MAELYILNKDFERIDLIEGINSLIWTERYNQYGDFTLRVPISKFPYTSMQTGFYAQLTSSRYLMIIDTVLRKRGSGTTDDYIEVKGRSFEAFLMERQVTPNTNNDYWTLTGTVGYIATELVRRICIDATELSPSDKIPKLTYATQDASTITRTVKLKPTDLYTAVKELCDEDGLGFRIYFDYDIESNSSTLVFRVYRGDDHSVTQSINARVVMSESLDTLRNGSYLRSSVGYKNVAYVKSKNLIRIVDQSSTTPLGGDRRVMWVDASDIENPTNDLLDSRGRLELSQNKYTNLVDGEFENNNAYVKGVDYNIGDVVTIDSEDGARNNVRIGEYITTYDSDGVRTYPTFSAL